MSLSLLSKTRGNHGRPGGRFRLTGCICDLITKRLKCKDGHIYHKGNQISTTIWKIKVYRHDFFIYLIRSIAMNFGKGDL